MLVPVGVFKGPAGFRSLAQSLWGKERNAALDFGNASYQFLRGDAADACSVIFGPDGEILERAGQLGSAGSYYNMPGKPAVPFYDLQEAIKPHLDKGLLGGLKPPDGAAPILTAIKMARYSEAMALLEQASKKGETNGFHKTLLERLAALEKSKLELFEQLKKDGDAWGAYKVGSSFARCFSKSKEVSDVKKEINSLKRDASVKDNLKAESIFQKLAQSLGKKTGPKAKQDIQAALQMMAQKYPKTEYGRIAASCGE